ncbi:hypothetical protein CERSUDRAFT_97099 [Gelatoporia subvermispora B]|uniref:Uncharacterized protein n=1 Tax=Ceriporiopsis subvermispora (strain B) TaxID=914234 RepID=M2R8W2_CERS8|nr:hypothetical protein CERSUDRAFT_97099 [Gelatoporia subvermispora B]
MGTQWKPWLLGPLDNYPLHSEAIRSARFLSYVARHTGIVHGVTVLKLDGSNGDGERRASMRQAAVVLKALLPDDVVKPEFRSVENLESFLKINKELQKALEDCWNRQDFTKVQALAFWYLPSLTDDIRQVDRGTVMNTDLQRKALSVAWEAEYHGGLHKLLRNNIQYAYRCGKRRRYGNFGCYVQGSGSGKSRTIQELGNLMLLIPFNFRRSDTGSLQSFPDPDHMVRDHFLSAKALPAEEQKNFFLTFFACLFQLVSDDIWYASQLTTYEKLAEFWKDQFMVRRAYFYSVVVEKHQLYLSSQVAFDAVDTATPRQDPETYAKESLRRLLCTMDLCVSNVARRMQFGRVKIVCSIDEADVLALTEVPANPAEGSLYDVLCTSIGVFRSLPIFFVFLSTNSQIALLAPPKSRMNSMGAKDNFSSLVPPFTETPFDCSPKFPLRSQTFKLSEIASVEFMCDLGRPLWGSLLRVKASELPGASLQLFDSPKSEASRAANRITPPTSISDAARAATYPMLTEILSLARAKLLGCGMLPSWNDSTKAQVLNRFYTPIRKRVLADVRVSLNYEPSRQRTYDELSTQVASHMRMVYSVPRHREYMRSGYSSEPILAEAAAQELKILRTSGIKGSTSLPQIVADALDNDICSVGERGEVVGRILLTLAYDRAIEKAHSLSGSTGPVNFNSGCSLIGFISELFTPEHAKRILDSRPDNAITNMTMREAFGNARVRFTHFGRLGDDGGITPQALLAAFLRGQAQMGHPTQEKIDVAIPVALDEDDLSVGKMTVLLVSFKRRLIAGARVEYEICADSLGVFCLPSLLDLKDQPYIALVMELGVAGRARYMPGPRHVPRPTKGDPAARIAEFGQSPAHSSLAKTPKTPVKMFLGRLGERRGDLRSAEEPLKLHPRYNIYAYGCSSKIYNVINREDKSEEATYHMLLADRDLFSEHPRRRSHASVKALLRQKPVWFTNYDSYHWISLNDMPARPEAVLLQEDENIRFVDDAVFAGKAGDICQDVQYNFLFQDVKDTRTTKLTRKDGGGESQKSGLAPDRLDENPQEKDFYENYDSDLGDDTHQGEAEDYGGGGGGDNDNDDVFYEKERGQYDPHHKATGGEAGNKIKGTQREGSETDDGEQQLELRTPRKMPNWRAERKTKK